MDTHTAEPTLKRCSRKDKCVNPLGCWLPATAEYFHRNVTGRDGLRSDCKVCGCDASRQYRLNNPERVRDGLHHWYITNLERVKVYHSQYRSANREKIQDSRRRYRIANAETIKERKYQYYCLNSEAIKERQRQYACENRDKLRRSQREWRRENPEKVRITHLRRHTRKLGLPDTFTETDWQRAVDYFHGCCAICGRQANDLFGTHTLSKDHWIAVTDTRPDNPGTVPENILPLCHGVDGCNNSKLNKDPIEWVTRQFGNRKAKQILARVEAYFQSLKEQLRTHDQ